jgi:DNA polymerase I
MPEALLLYVPDPYGVGASRYAIFQQGALREINPSGLAAIDAMVFSYDIPALSDELRRLDCHLPEVIVDLAEGVRLFVGVSKADGGEKLWDFWQCAKQFFDNNEIWSKSRALHQGRISAPKDYDYDGHFTLLGAALEKMLAWMNAELDKAGEAKRFYELEVPLASIFFKRQIKGIAVRRDIVNQALERAKRRKYTAYAEVASLLNVSPTGLNYWNVRGHLENSDLHEANILVDGYALRDQLKIARSSSKFAVAFTDYMDATRDVETLTRLSSSGERVFPTFHPIGTISARTLVSDPYLQELRRDLRSVLAADPDMKLKYFDFAQFEPGILATLCGDKSLIELYDKGDIYQALSVHIFGDVEHRNLCKRIFLAFSYGMTAGSIAKLLSGDNEEVLRIKNDVEVFFGSFPRLNEYRAEVENLLLRTGQVSTFMGNRRVRQSASAKLSAKEKRWGLSQIVQGNASLVFKTALAKISRRFGDNSILLPMHDAVLMQFNEASEADILREVPLIMKEAFSSYFESVTPRVVVGDF